MWGMRHNCLAYNNEVLTQFYLFFVCYVCMNIYFVTLSMCMSECVSTSVNRFTYMSVNRSLVDTGNFSSLTLHFEKLINLVNRFWRPSCLNPIVLNDVLLLFFWLFSLLWGKAFEGPTT